MQPQQADRTRPAMGVTPGLRRPVGGDGPSLWTLAADAGLDVNSPYAYVMWTEYFADTSVVATDDDRVVGFITGFRVPGQPDVVFVWQVAVASDHRRRGIAGLMLDDLVAHTGARAIEATVTPSNTASAALFRSLGERHGTIVDETLLFGEHLFPDGHEAEIRFRVPLVHEPSASAASRRGAGAGERLGQTAAR